VGQAQLASLHGWTTPPRWYSYYAFNPGTNRLCDIDDGTACANHNTVGVVSYGVLHRMPVAAGQPPYWIPGNRLMQATGTDDDTTIWCGGGENTITNLQTKSALQKNCVSGAGTKDTQVANVIHATRSGFKDGHATRSAFIGDNDVGVNNVSWRNRRSQHLPQNLDVAALQAALNDTSVGELGWHFSNVGRPFNGIVYLTNSWPGSMDNFSAAGTGVAESWPNQGALDSTTATGVTSQFASATTFQQLPSGRVAGNWDNHASDDFHHLEQNALPYHLCSGNLGGDPYDPAGVGGARFLIPDCADYDYTSLVAPRLAAFPTFVRVHNGAHLNPAADQAYAASGVPADTLPEGLSVVTNIPVGVLGEFNTSSDVTSEAAAPWFPGLVAGDMLYMMSNAWTDTASPWGAGDISHGSSGIDPFKRSASDTTYNVAVLAGWTAISETQINNMHSGGVHNFSRYLERWGARHIVNGSFLVGFGSVYSRVAISFSGQAFGAPQREWRFDPHLNALGNQPPGAPRYTVAATESWTAQ